MQQNNADGIPSSGGDQTQLVQGLNIVDSAQEASVMDPNCEPFWMEEIQRIVVPYRSHQPPNLMLLKGGITYRSKGKEG